MFTVAKGPGDIISNVCKQGKVTVDRSSSSVGVTVVDIECAIGTTDEQSAIGIWAGEKSAWRSWELADVAERAVSVAARVALRR